VHACEIRWVPWQLPFVLSDLPRHGGVANQVFPLAAFDDAFDSVRDAAVRRIDEQAVAAEASAVVGVRPLAAGISWDRVRARSEPQQGIPVRASVSSPRRGVVDHRRVEYGLTGTAVCDRGADRGSPRLSTLTAAEFWKLRRAGWRAVGIAAGCSFHTVIGQFLWAQSTGSPEVTAASEAWARSRAQASARLQAAGSVLGADGIVAVETRVHRHSFVFMTHGRQIHGMVLGIELIGTAVMMGSATSVPGDPLGRVLMLR
jgi:uncharacterized protein YbjQ (UPF0145 family)